MVTSCPLPADSESRERRMRDRRDRDRGILQELSTGIRFSLRGKAKQDETGCYKALNGAVELHTNEFTPYSCLFKTVWRRYTGACLWCLCMVF